MADWIKIKNEYVTTDISQRKLAEKYNVNPSTVARHCNSENWTELRKKNASKMQAKCTQKTIEKIAEKESQQVVDGLSLLTDMLGDIVSIKTKLSASLQALDIDKAEKTLIRNTEDGRAIIKDKAGIEKAEKLAMAYGRIIKSVVDVVDTQKRYGDVAEEYEDDGLIAALESSAEELNEDDDSGMLPEDSD